MGLLEETLSAIRSVDDDMRKQARRRIARLTMPYWALGRLCDLAVDLCGMTGALKPPVERTAAAVFAGDHGVTDEGVSPSPKAVTVQMVHNFLAGGAGINVFSRMTGTRLAVVDVGVDADLSGLEGREGFIPAKVARGTANLAAGPAMDPDTARRSVEAGIRVALTLGRDADLLATGEMGIGNTTPASAIVACLGRESVASVTGRGCGLDDEGMARKIAVIERGLEINRPDPSDPLDVLAKVGGLEIGAMAGFMLGAASIRKPVVLDGLICTAGALLARSWSPASAGYMIAGHRSVEAGHQPMHTLLGLKPLLDLDLRLGEGTGAVLAFPLVQAAGRMIAEMATFDDAAVSRYDERDE